MRASWTKADNMYMVGSGCYKWYQSRSSIPICVYVPFGPVGVFICLVLQSHKGCLSYPILDRGETS